MGAQPTSRIEYARLLKDEAGSLGQIATKAESEHIPVPLTRIDIGRRRRRRRRQLADEIVAGNPVGGGIDLPRYFAESSHQHRASANPPLAELVAAIESNPLFAMSLGSKELFHSNLLAWFIRHHPEVRTALLNDWAGAPALGPARVSREWKNMDLVLQSAEHMLVIENKTFAPPDENQLDRFVGRFAYLVAVVGRPGPDELLMLPKEQRALLKISHLDAPVQKMRSRPWWPYCAHSACRPPRA